LTPLWIASGDQTARIGLSESGVKPPHSKLQQSLYDFRWSAQHCAISALDDRPLNQIRMLCHQRDDFVICELAFAQAKFAIDGFTLPEKFTRLDSHFLD